MSSQPMCKGCLLVGSAPMSTTEEVFREFLAGLPGRLKRIPDGETGPRHYFTLWQWNLIGEQAPGLKGQFHDNASLKINEFTPEQIEKELLKFKPNNFKTGYDDAALESYAKFRSLKDENIIPPAVKFQVCLPALASVVGVFVEPAFQPGFAPIYEEALFKAIRIIQDEIPHDQLAIQIDLAADTAIWEGVLVKWWGEGDPKQGVVDYIVRMIKQIDGDVELGIHNCYGDMEHKHFLEPKSLAAITERAAALYANNIRPLQWFHVPVPLSAMDKLNAYFEPLKEILPKFRQDGTELYLGLVHPGDLDGTKQRIEAARKVFGEDMDFGVASECGWGRTPRDQLESIMSISRAVSEPVV